MNDPKFTSSQRKLGSLASEQNDSGPSFRWDDEFFQ